MTKRTDTNPGQAVDSSGNAVVDPTANVLKLVDEAVRRINDIHVLQKEFNAAMLQAEVKRLDDLRDVQVKRLEDSLRDHKEFNRVMYDQERRHIQELSAEKELRLQQKFDALDKAIQKADSATEKRFDAVNEFRNTLSDQQRTLMPRQEYESTHASLTQMMLGIEKRVDKNENVKEGGSLVWAYVIGGAGFVTGLVSFLLGLFGK